MKEFDIDIKYRCVVEKVLANHISRLSTKFLPLF